jgi:hypothetical protein
MAVAIIGRLLLLSDQERANSAGQRLSGHYRPSPTTTNGAQCEGCAFTSVSELKTGWTLGGGLEMPIASNTTFKAEYLFTAFNNLSTHGNKIIPLSDAPNPPDFACGVDTGQGGVAPFGFLTPRRHDSASITKPICSCTA